MEWSVQGSIGEQESLYVSMQRMEDREGQAGPEETRPKRNVESGVWRVLSGRL